MFEVKNRLALPGVVLVEIASRETFRFESDGSINFPIRTAALIEPTNAAGESWQSVLLKNIEQA